MMGFRGKNRFASAGLAALVFVLCLGAAGAGAYAAVSFSASKGNFGLKPNQPMVSAKPYETGDLALTKKEFTAAELKSLDISGAVVEVLSEDVSIVRGGDALRFEYYAGSGNEYTLQRESDGGQSRWNLCLRRISPSGLDAPSGPIAITVPYGMSLKTISAETVSGNIYFKDCSAGKHMSVKTQSGQAVIDGGSAEGFFAVETGTGNALISGTILPLGETGATSTKFSTESGAILFQPAGSPWDYSYYLDTGKEAQITVNGKKYQGGENIVNPAKGKNIFFESFNGTLTVQDLSLGKWEAGFSEIQPNPVSSIQPEPCDNQQLARAKKQYSESQLKKMGIAGIRVEALGENITVSQGGDSLIIEYGQSGSTDYALGIKEYELYNEEYLTREELALKGGRSGKVKELVLTGSAMPGGGERTISITLPGNPQYSRAVQLFSEGGNIQMSQLNNTDMLAAETKGGNINVQNCHGPYLGTESESGGIQVTASNIGLLSAKTVSGDMSVQLPGRAADYRLEADTGAKGRVSINGIAYPGGKCLINEAAPNSILFDSGSGSLTVVETAGK